MNDINKMSANSGRMLNESNNIVNVANILQNLNDNGLALTGRRTAIGGRVTVLTAGTPVSLGTADVGEGVYIVADPANTSAVYVFPAAGVKTDSVPLWPGDSDFWPVSNLSALKIDSIINGDGIYWKAAI